MNNEESPFDTVEAAIAEIGAGRLVVVTDDEDRENEGDLIMAAEKVTAETVNMMIRYCSGIICVPALEPQLKRLGLNPMVMTNRESHRTDFTVSVDAAEGVTTGISAYDRAVAIRLLGNPETRPEQLVQPGHVFPLRSRPGGVLERAGHTEAAVDLATLAGCTPAGVLCEVVNEDGTMARLGDLVRFKKEHNLKMISIAQLIAYRHQRDQLVERIGVESFCSALGEFDLHTFRSQIDGAHHYALTKGALDKEPTLVRVQGEDRIHDVFGHGNVGSRAALEGALRRIEAEGKGAFVYMTQNTMRTSAGPREAKPTTEKGSESESGKMDFRQYGVGAQILSALGLRQIRLLSSTPRHVIGLEGYDLEIVEQVALQ